jgi:hypothetical protein
MAAVTAVSPLAAAEVDSTLEEIPQTSRYSKRRRQQIKYYESDDDGNDDLDESDENERRVKVE